MSSLVLAVTSPPSTVLLVLAALAVCTVAVASALQAGSMGHYGWLSGFVVLALLFNPITAADLPRMVTLALSLATAAAFIGWLIILQRDASMLSVAQVLHPSDVK